LHYDGFAFPVVASFVHQSVHRRMKAEKVFDVAVGDVNAGYA